MKNLAQSSETLVGSLCREIDTIRIRSSNISYSLKSCRDNYLLKRLIKEINSLDNRRIEIQKIANSISNIKDLDNLAIEFLKEIANRPINTLRTI